jgi:hypothetical protein
MLCDFCRDISIQKLLVRFHSGPSDSWPEFKAKFPDQSVHLFLEHAFKHQPSYDALVKSARGGCPLCESIWKECLRPRLSDDIKSEWILDEKLKGNNSRNGCYRLRMCLGARQRGWPFESIVFDALYIELGYDAILTLVVSCLRGMSRQYLRSSNISSNVLTLCRNQ